jgi:hypothetical protein
VKGGEHAQDPGAVLAVGVTAATNAHENIPETTGTGTTTPGHMAVPGTGNVTPCGHGG